MAITRYRIMVSLDFDTAAKRDTVYDKMKVALANAKISDAWISGTITKDEYSRPDSSNESV